MLCIFLLPRYAVGTAVEKGLSFVENMTAGTGRSAGMDHSAGMGRSDDTDCFAEQAYFGTGHSDGTGRSDDTGCFAEQAHFERGRSDDSQYYVKQETGSKFAP